VSISHVKRFRYSMLHILLSLSLSLSVYLVITLSKTETNHVVLSIFHNCFSSIYLKIFLFFTSMAIDRICHCTHLVSFCVHSSCVVCSFYQHSISFSAKNENKMSIYKNRNVHIYRHQFACCVLFEFERFYLLSFQLLDNVSIVCRLLSSSISIM
jgi:hypothetical protein